MLRAILVGCVMWLAVTNVGSACQQCGLFGRLCRIQNHAVVAKKQHVQSVVVPAAVVKQPDVFVVQNNYPPHIGAYAQQGTSVYGPAYGVKEAFQAHYVSPVEMQRQTVELTKAALAMGNLAFTGYNNMVQGQLELNATIAGPLARGHAAAQVLGAAGLSDASSGKAESVILKISGNQVERIPVAEYEARVSASIGPAAEAVPVAPQPSGAVSYVKQFCARCHGLELSEPKGSIYVDGGHKLDCKIANRAAYLVAVEKNPDKRMPKDGPELTPQEKGLLVEELLRLSKEE